MPSNIAYVNIPCYGKYKMAIADSHLRQEGAAFCDAYWACGFEIPPQITGDALCRAVAIPFIPQESPSLLELPGLTNSDRRYFGQEVYPEIIERVADEDPNVLGLGRATGRCMGAAIEANRLAVESPIRVLPQTVLADGEQVPVTFSTGRVVELGMGVNGLMPHIDQVRAGRYSLAAISNRVGEVALLEGLASYFGIEDNVIIDGSGVGPCLRDMLDPESPYAGGTDMVVVSRVWTSDPEFKKGLKRVAGLLRPEGVVIARGTAESEDGCMGYKEIGKVLERDSRLAVEAKRTYQRDLPLGLSLEQQLVIARRSAR